MADFGCETRRNRWLWCTFLVCLAIAIAMAIGVAVRGNTCYNEYDDCMNEDVKRGNITAAQYEQWHISRGSHRAWNTLGDTGIIGIDICENSYNDCASSPVAAMFAFMIIFIVAACVPCCVMCCTVPLYDPPESAIMMQPYPARYGAPPGYSMPASTAPSAYQYQPPSMPYQPPTANGHAVPPPQPQSQPPLSAMPYKY